MKHKHANQPKAKPNQTINCLKSIEHPGAGSAQGSASARMVIMVTMEHGVLSQDLVAFSTVTVRKEYFWQFQCKCVQRALYGR